VSRQGIARTLDEIKIDDGVGFARLKCDGSARSEEARNVAMKAAMTTALLNGTAQEPRVRKGLTGPDGFLWPCDT